MKKSLIKFVSIAALSLLLGLSANAQSTFSTNVTAGGTGVLFTYPVQITSVTVVGASVGPTTVKLYDNTTASTTYTNAAYTSATTYATNITSVITNSLGNLQTNTFTGYFTTTQSNAAATNTLPLLGTFSAGTSASTTSSVNIQTVRGLIANYTTNATLTVTYRRLN